MAMRMTLSPDGGAADLVASFSYHSLEKDFAA